MRAEELLPLHLSAEVPLHIAELQEKGGPDAADFLLAQQAGQAIATRGDRLLHRCGKKGETAALISELAFGVVVLSFLPGGITVFGQHWEALSTRHTYTYEGERGQ